MRALWNKTKKWLNTNNHLLWASIIALIVLGLIGVYFIGPYEMARGGWEKAWGTNSLFNRFWKTMLIGIIVLFAFSKLSKKWVVRLSWILGIFAFLLMVSTMVWPHYIAGSSRFVSLGILFLDPFAMMLPPYIVLMSHWLSKDKPNKAWTTIGTATLTLFIILAAIHAPYIFMAQVYLLMFLIMTFKARKNVPGPFYVGIGILIGFVAIIGLAMWHFPHVQYRIMNISGNYATQMSLHAMTSSALVGNTAESLTALSRLPGSTTDFAFTSMIAKFGMLMGLLILALYGCVAKGLTDTIRNTKDKFKKMLSTGTLGLFAIYIIMALLVAFGMLATAAYWPFIGYGSTMFWTWCILFGFVIAANRE